MHLPTDCSRSIVSDVSSLLRLDKAALSSSRSASVIESGPVCSAARRRGIFSSAKYSSCVFDHGSNGKLVLLAICLSTKSHADHSQRCAVRWWSLLGVQAHTQIILARAFQQQHVRAQSFSCQSEQGFQTSLLALQNTINDINDNCQEKQELQGARRDCSIAAARSSTSFELIPTLIVSMETYRKCSA